VLTYKVPSAEEKKQFLDGLAKGGKRMVGVSALRELTETKLTRGVNSVVALRTSLTVEGNLASE